MSFHSQDAGALPVRTPRSRTTGRHRKPHSFTLPENAPALVLAVPDVSSGPGAPIAAEIAARTDAAGQGVDIRVGYLEGDDTSLSEALTGLPVDYPAGAPAAVVVPLVTGPYPGLDESLRRMVATAEAPVRITDPLGPHPLLAEALHVSLAESGLAREDRIRLFNVVTAPADGIAVATVGGDEAAQAAESTCVLLASRLAVPVMPAALDGSPGPREAVERLRGAGASRIALAPCFLGYEVGADRLAGAARDVGAQAAQPLGTQPEVATLVTVRYAAALNIVAPDAESVEDTS